MGGDLEDPKFIKSTMSDQNIHVGMKTLRPCRARRANEASLFVLYMVVQPLGDSVNNACVWTFCTALT